MRFGILGTGVAGKTIAARLDAMGHGEMLLPMWLRLFGVLQKPVFNFKIVR